MSKKIILWTLFSLLFLPAVFAYEFQPSALEEKGPLSEKQQRTDINGDKCAVLFLETDIEELKLVPSLLGDCGIEKTAKGYEIYLPEGTRHITLRAPSFRELRWQFERIRPAQYRATIDKSGVDASQLNAVVKVSGTFKYDMFGLAARWLDDHRPILKINTDLPFSFLKEHLLKDGAYEEVDTQAAAYVLRVPPNTTVEQIIRKDFIQSDLPWNETLEEKNTYALDLSWQVQQ